MFTVEDGLTYALETRDFSWSFFCTLTLKPGCDNKRVGERLFFAWLRSVARAWGVPFSALVWVRRAERGEKNGRLHYHLLLWSRSVPATISSCFKIKYLWKSVAGSISQVRLFEANRDFADYLLKVPRAIQHELDGVTGDWSVSGANRYERAKFKLADVSLSRSLFEMMRRKRGRSDTGPSQCNATSG